MKDSQLFLVVAVLLAMDITIMTTWQLADPFYRETRELKPYVSAIPIISLLSLFLRLDKSQLTNDHHFLFQPQYGDADFIIIPQNEMCKSYRMNVFIGVIYAYKGLLLVSNSKFEILIREAAKYYFFLSRKCQIVSFYYFGAKLSVFTILVPHYPVLNCPGAKLSGAKLSDL